eukprot:363738-Chlamydomonas_euryale.AAC.4
MDGRMAVRSVAAAECVQRERHCMCVASCRFGCTCAAICVMCGDAQCRTPMCTTVHTLAQPALHDAAVHGEMSSAWRDTPCMHGKRSVLAWQCAACWHDEAQHAGMMRRSVLA